MPTCPKCGHRWPRAKSTEPKPPKVIVTWLTKYADLWRKHYGGEMNMGQAAKALGRLEVADAAETVRRWDIYLSETDAQYASPSKFGSTFGRWNGAAPSKPLGKVEQGRANLTEWLEEKESRIPAGCSDVSREGF